MRDSESSTDERLAAMAAGLRLEDIPQDVQEASIDCIIDTVAVALAGAGDEVTQQMARLASGSGDAVLIGWHGTANPRHAALINATAAHVLDFDDWLPAARVHPSAPLVPAALAAAQAQAAPVSGQRLVTALIAGFETQARIGAAIVPAHYDAGFHPTATVCTFGAAAASAHLAGASPREMGDALGVAATSAAGIRAAFGTAVKSIQVGKAAEDGVLAAQIATSGLGPLAIPVLGERGFAASHGHAVDHEVASTSFGERWFLREVSVKEHASCFGTHAPIDAILGLREALPIDRIATIDVTVNEMMRTVCAIPSPTTALEGKFSLAFTSALAVVRGRSSVSDFTRDTVSDPDLLDMSRRVRVHFDPSLPAQWAKVRITLDSGEVRAAEHDSAAPMPAERRRKLARDKLAALATPIVGEAGAAEILAVIEGLVHGRSVADLAAAVGTGKS